MQSNEPHKKKCVEQILTAKKRVNEESIKVVNKVLNKSSPPRFTQILQYLVGMLQGKGGDMSDNIGVELYFKKLEGLLLSLENFNFKEVKPANA